MRSFSIINVLFCFSKFNSEPKPIQDSPATAIKITKAYNSPVGPFKKNEVLIKFKKH